MSLLDNASLLLTPNACKEGKLYSVIPSNGNGDFTATRATTATRVNSSGLVDLVPYNLFTWSEMFTNALWTKTATSVTANTTTAPDGTLTADTLSIGVDASNQRHRLFSLQTFQSGTPYTYSIYLKQNQFRWVQITSQAAFNAADWCNFDLQDGVIGNNGGGFISQTITDAGNGWWRISVTTTAISSVTSDIDVVVTTNGTDSSRYPSWQSLSAVDCYYVWGAQLVEGTSARDYLRTETRLNIPRVDYSLGGCPNILLEPQRTNLSLQSSSFDSASWSKASVTVNANSTTSPSGVVDADKLIETATTSSHVIGNASISIVSGQIYTFSFFAKKSERTFIQLAPSSTTFGNVFVNYNLGNGTISLTGGTIVSSSIESVGNGWYRCIASITATTTASTGPMNLLLIDSGTAPRFQSYLGDGTSGLFVWGAQLEAGAYATSFIPTTTASVTRNADTLTRNNIFTNGLITAAGGTWFVELRNNVSYTRDSVGGIWIGDNTTAGTLGNTLVIRNGGASQRQSIGKTISGSFTFLFTTTTDTVKLAIKWNGTTADIFQNGVKVIAATAFTPTNMDFLVGNGNDVPKSINEMALFPTPLTDAQCLALTA